MNSNPFENALNIISDALIKQEKISAINIQAFGRNDADSASFYFYQFEGEFNNGKANGVCKRYNECGALIQEGVFLDGNPIVIYDYSTNGTIVWFHASNGEIIEKDISKDVPRMRDIKNLNTLEV